MSTSQKSKPYTVTKEDIREWWYEFNHKFFNDELEEPLFRIRECRAHIGMYNIWQKPHDGHLEGIDIINTYNQTKKQYQCVLLHEMIHQWQYFLERNKNSNSGECELQITPFVAKKMLGALTKANFEKDRGHGVTFDIKAYHIQELSNNFYTKRMIKHGRTLHTTNKEIIERSSPTRAYIISWKAVGREGFTSLIRVSKKFIKENISNIYSTISSFEEIKKDSLRCFEAESREFALLHKNYNLNHIRVHCIPDKEYEGRICSTIVSEMKIL